jgi:hypothetical protein
VLLTNINVLYFSQFKEQAGHCRVPKGYTKDHELANWVRNQRLEEANRRKGKKSRMTIDRFNALNELGFKWSTFTPSRSKNKTRTSTGEVGPDTLSPDERRAVHGEAVAAKEAGSADDLVEESGTSEWVVSDATGLGEDSGTLERLLPRDDDNCAGDAAGGAEDSGTSQKVIPGEDDEHEGDVIDIGEQIVTPGRFISAGDDDIQLDAAGAGEDNRIFQRVVPREVDNNEDVSTGEEKGTSKREAPGGDNDDQGRAAGETEENFADERIMSENCDDDKGDPSEETVVPGADGDNAVEI